MLKVLPICNIVKNAEINYKKILLKTQCWWWVDYNLELEFYTCMLLLYLYNNYHNKDNKIKIMIKRLFYIIETLILNK